MQQVLWTGALTGGPEEGCNNARDLVGEQGRHCISDLVILLRAVPDEEVIVGKGLQARCLSDGKTAHLVWVWMDVIVPVF